MNTSQRGNEMTQHNYENYELPKTGLTVEQFLKQGLEALKKSAALNGEDVSFTIADSLLRTCNQALPSCGHINAEIEPYTCVDCGQTV